MRYSKWALRLAILLLAAIGFAQKPEPPDPPPLGKVDFPAYETRTLANGLTVYALEHREQPVVSIRLLIGAGAANDPAGLPGVASFTAGLLRQGTAARTATQLAETIDQTGGSIEVSADMESTTIAAGFLKEHAGLALELMADMIRNPAFDEKEIERLRQQSLSGLSAQMEEPDFIADAVLEAVLYGAHPYGRLESGTLRSIPLIGRKEIVSFHQNHYAPNISVLAIVGDLSSKEIFELAERHFAGWQRKQVPAPANPPFPKTNGRRVVAVDRPGSVQTEIRVGQRIVPRKDPDYFKFLLANLVLGGSAEARLNQKLRVEKGLTYGAFSSIGPRKGPSSFYAVTETRTEKTAEAVNLVLEEFNRLRLSEPTPPELTEAKTLIIGGFPLTIELPSDLGTRLTTVFLYDLGPDYLKTYRDRIAAVTAADVLRVSKERLSAQDAPIVLVGDVGAFKASIEKLGKVEVIPAAKLDLESPTLVSKD